MTINDNLMTPKGQLTRNKTEIMNKPKNRKTGLLKYTWIIAAAWTLILIGLLSLDIAKLTQATENLAIREARTHFQKDKAFRYWATTHGGFYVPIDERTPANPKLSHIFERDIETPSGKKLTLMNPAYALRQMNEDFAETYGIFGHITSLLPLRPENSADVWETKALKSFETGESEVLEFTEFEGVRSLRLMSPLVVKKGCLKCHAHQGYKVGDIRGGTSVTIPMTAYSTQKQHTAQNQKLSYALIWLLGFISIFQGSRAIKKNDFDRIEAQYLLKESYAQLEEKVLERTSELDQSNQKLQSVINEGKLAKEAVKTEKHFSERILNTSSAFIVGLDKNHIIQLFNKGAEKITGYTKEDVIGKDWFKTFLSKEIWDELDKVWKEAWGISFNSYINSILSSTGEEKVISWQSTGFYEDKDVDKHLLISIGEDITERTKAEEELTKHREHLEELVNERTKELDNTLKVFAGREQRIKDLEERIKALGG